MDNLGNTTTLGGGLSPPSKKMDMATITIEGIIEGYDH